MNRLPKISIVTPSYNKGKYIEETIKSVLSQDYDNYEYIVMDGGSTDNTLDILKKYDNITGNNKVFRWISEKDKGQTDAINKGLRICRGDWFAFINADDFYSPSLFSSIAEFLLLNKDAGIIYGNQYDLFDSGEKKERILRKPSPQVTFNDLLYGNQIYGPASFYNMEALKETGEFDASLYYWMDWDMYLRISKIMPLRYIDYNIATFRITKEMKSPANSANRKNYKKFQREAHYVSVKHGGRYFSGKWLQRSPLYGKYKFYLRRYEKEPGALEHDNLDNAKVSRIYMMLTLSVHYTLKPLIRIINKVKKYYGGKS